MDRGGSGNAIKDRAITVHATTWQRNLIDRAAQVLGKSRSEFMLDAACRAAEEVLPDQIDFRIDPQAFAQFTAMLDNPPPPTEVLRRLLSRTPAWE